MNRAAKLFSSATAEKNRIWVGGLILILAVLAAYHPVWHAGFIWDDDVYVTGNRLLSAPDGWRRIWFSGDSPSQYFPLTYTVLRWEKDLWGLQPAGYHWINLILHGLNAVLVWRVLARLRLPAPWLAAALFALHPVEVETAAWITEIKNLLALFFSLLAMRSWLEFTGESTRPLKRYYLLTLLFYLLALAGKTTACTLPAALLLVLWLQRKPLGGWRWAQMVPFLVFGAGIGLLSIWWERHHQNAVGQTFAIGFLSRLLIASRGLWFYAGKLIWPVDLSFSYPRWELHPENPSAWGWLAALLLLALVFYLTRSLSGRGPIVAALYFAATLSPLLGFIMEYTFKYSFVADHYQYAASIGPLALIAAGLDRLGKRIGLRRAIQLLVVLTLGCLTLRQARIYANSETLWRDTVAKNPASTMARNNLGGEWLRQNRPAEAMQLEESVLHDVPQDVTGLFNRADALMEEDRLDEALAGFRQAWQLEPGRAGIPYYIGQLYLKKSQPQLAEPYFERATQLKPDYAEAYCNLGYALLLQHKLVPAAAAYDQALKLDPDYALAHNDLGNIFLQTGRVDEALLQFQKAVQAAPEFAEAHYNIGNICLTQSRLEMAQSEFEKALAVQPNLAEAHEKLAVIFARSRRWDEAVTQYENALRLNSNSMNTSALRNYAAVLSETGQFEKAAAIVHKVRSFPHLTPEMEAALAQEEALYRAHTPLPQTSP